MEALIVALFALIVIVLLDAGYALVIALLRTAPVLASAALIGWLTHRASIDPLAALGLAFPGYGAVRRLMRKS